MIPKLPFGRTGHMSTRILFGSYALSDATLNEAEKVLEVLLENGVNHIDTAHSYGNAEKLIGPWMKKHRDDFFLATKSGNRSYKGAWKDLLSSLDRLKVDQIDLWQMHGLTNQAGWEKAMGPDGALKAFIEARQKGLVRYLGVTGHGYKAPAMHKRSLERYDFDSVLLPYNYCQMQNPRYANDLNELIEVCHKKKVAIQTIKSIARRPWQKGPKTYHTYIYEPLETQDSINKAIHWALSLKDNFVISAGDIRLLPRVLAAGKCYEKSPSEVEMKTMQDELDFQPIFSY